VPNATAIALLVDPNTPASESERIAIEAAARAIGQQTEIVRASTETEIERAFMAIAQRHLGALLVTGDPFFFAARKYAKARQAGSESRFQLIDDTDVAGTIPYLPKG
jgi:putative tryptophan/tyrosine transport system substrate-binding protein